MSEFVDTSGNFGDMAGAPESVSSLVASKGFKSVEDLANGYKEEVAFKGSFAEKLNIPAELTDEMTAEMRTRMGVPANVDGYDLGDAGKTLKPEVIAELKKMGVEQGFTPNQLKTGLNLINELGNAQQQEILDIALKSEDEMKAEMGDKFQPYLDSAIATADKLGILQTLKDTGLVARKEVLGAMHKISEMISEDALKPAEDVTKATKLEKRKQLETNPALMDKMHPDHHEVHKEWLDTMLPG